MEKLNHKSYFLCIWVPQYENIAMSNLFREINQFHSVRTVCTESPLVQMTKKE